MKQLNVLVLLLGLLMLAACKIDLLSGANDPKSGTWSVDHHAPSYMQGWVEFSAVEDINGRMFRSVGGSIGTGDPGLDQEYAKGWQVMGGDFFPVSGADLPKRVFVRWQSIVEQKTYKGWVDIPEDARSIMRGSTARRCPDWPDHAANFSAGMYIGLAPGGVMKVWVENNCGHNILVAGAQAEIEPLGPSQGLTQGQFAYPIREPSKRYIERYGIPYGSW